MMSHVEQRQLLPRRLEISYQMFTESDDDDEDIMKDMSDAHNLSFLSVDLFMAMIDHSIVTDIDNLPIVDQWTDDYFDNNVIVLPELIEGELLAALHRKLNVITHKSTVIPLVQIKDMDENLTFSLGLSDVDTRILPEQDEWLGEYPYWETAWWNRNDISTYDNFAETKREWTAWKKEQPRLDQIAQEPLRMLSKSINNITGPGELIEIDFKEKSKAKAWTPRVV